MKTFSRTSLPSEINYNNKTYVRGEKTSKSIKVEVLSSRLKGKRNVHGSLYKPTVHYYNPK